MEAFQAGDFNQLLNDLLVWTGYGTIVGLLAKAVMPGRDPGGTVATLAMGITGVVIGCGSWSLLFEGRPITPLSGPGLLCGTAGALVILVFYRVLRGPLGERRQIATAPPHRRRVPRRYRQADLVEYFDD
jgi:uncharacterized membrane protein YeaQ/YmgE (transglycosylase-associated protein family)